MSSIVRQKVGNKIYLYESVSYRNDDGKPRNKRVPIGKIDGETGRPIYKPEYLTRMLAAGTPINIPATDLKFSVTDITNSQVRAHGAFYLFENVAKNIGLIPSLKSSIPNYWQEVFMLACYIVSSGEPFLYCDDWLHGSSTLPVGNMSSQRISELLTAITADMREDFYQMWCKYRSEQEYLALDITSTSSYSKLIDDVEWGYNRDKEKLAQINICMLMGEKSRLPIYQTIYSGSLKDVSTLKTTLSKMDAISDGSPMLVVMDKGFYSTNNINAMLNDRSNMCFIIAVPFTASFAKKQIESEHRDIDQLKNTIVIGGDSIRGVTKRRSWSKKHRLYTHIYFNPIKAIKARDEIYTHVTALKEQAEINPADYIQKEEHRRYLLIRRSEKSLSGYTISIKKDVVNKELETAGWMVILSNDVSDAKEALSIYRGKDVVEKGFMILKNSLDLGRIRTHRNDTMQNKMFIGFIALILSAFIHKVMSDNNLYKQMTMKKLIITLAKLRVQEINGHKIMYPLTKKQKQIFKVFGLAEPV